MRWQVTCRRVNIVYKAGPGRRRHRECRSQKRKNLQELYIHGTRIAGSPGRGLIPMDAIYLLILVGLYLTTHGLVLVFNRLGKTP
jgi:hypothetical protein